MLSLLIVFILTAILPSAVNGDVVEHQDAYARIIQCLKMGYSSDGDVEEIASDVLDKSICGFWKSYGECLAQPFYSTSPSMELLHFNRAYEWQKGIVAIKSKFCTDLNLEDLKDLALKSGIMERENLPNIEGDDYEPCVGDAHRECIVRAIEAFQKHIFDAPVFFKCHEEQARTCKAPMMQHLNEYVFAFKKHMEENDGVYGKMLFDLETSYWHSEKTEL